MSGPSSSENPGERSGEDPAENPAENVQENSDESSDGSREASADEPTPPHGTPSSIPAWDPAAGGTGAPSAFASPSDGPPTSGGPAAGPPPGYGGPGYGGPGYGGPGYGGYGQGPPTWGAPGPGPAGFGGGPGPAFGRAPRPGIVALRPLGLGEILDGALGYIRAHPKVVLGASAVVAVISQIIQVVLALVVTSSASGLSGSPDLAQVTGVAAGAGVTGLVGAVITLVATSVLTGVLMVVISRSLLGAPVDSGEVWRAARPRVPGVLGIAVLVALIAFGVFAVGVLPGVLLLLVDRLLGGLVIVVGVLAAIVVVVWLSVSWSLATPAYVLEGVGVTEALRRSWFLVRGRFWPVLGIQLLGGIIATVIATVISLPFQFAGTAVAATSNGDPASVTSLPVLLITAIGAIIAATLTTPFQAGVSGLLYVDQRMRREGFDIELQRAAVGAAGGAGGP